ncbi:MAG TPA: L-fucose/L-arabinose isomerase family protein [Armatimonadota bacterium]|jgi:L-fucose isomerase-like protein
MATQTTLGVIVGNRGFFPDHLCDEGRKQVLSVLANQGIKTIALTPEETPFGSVETREQAKKCAALFRKHADEIDGILVTLPNFGDERGIAESIRLSGLDVPILMQAYPDDAGRMSIKDRRDSFCGKLSACNNLTQYGIPYTLTTLHTVAPTSASFLADLKRFEATCRVVKGLSTARIGAIGARPAAFKTVRYSEKILEANGITIETIDLSEVLGKVGLLDNGAEAVQAKLKAIGEYVDAKNVPAEPLMKMAKLAVVIDDWMDENELNATTIQCWTAIEEFFGVVPCTVMSMLSNKLLPSACEVDVMGALSMYALTLATGVPAALLDWNNNYGEDPDKCVLFHCSNLPTGCLSCAKMSQQWIVGGTVGLEKTWGTVEGRIKSGPFTYVRASTSDMDGTLCAYVGEGEFTDDPLDTFGGAGVARIADLQGLMRFLCEQGYEHHVAVSHDTVSEAITEALSTYLGWDVFQHGG